VSRFAGKSQDRGTPFCLTQYPIIIYCDHGVSRFAGVKAKTVVRLFFNTLSNHIL
jgi:hypothetical protein